MTYLSGGLGSCPAVSCHCEERNGRSNLLRLSRRSLWLTMRLALHGGRKHTARGRSTPAEPLRYAGRMRKKRYQPEEAV